MKKSLLFLLALIITSCSSEKVADDPIIGSWSLVKSMDFTAAGETVEHEAGECAQKENMTFNSNSELYSEHYYMNEIMECKLNETATGTYIWTKVSEGIYNLKRESPTGRNYEFSFPNSNTMWMVTGGAFEVDGVKYEKTVHVYTRR